MRYAFTVEGRAASGQTWRVSGTVETANRGEFALAPALALREAFTALTMGMAVYGQPGVGCQGPYQVTSLTIKEDAQ